MKFEMIHENYNVSDLDKSIAFYEKALGLYEKRRKTGDGYIINIRAMQLNIIRAVWRHALQFCNILQGMVMCA